MGASVQGVVGLGIGLVTAPLVGLLEPALLPGLPLWVAAAYPLLTFARDRHHVDWRGLVWAMPARVPGTAVGVLVVATVSDRVTGVAVGAMVLLAVVLSVRTVAVRPTRGSLVAAGFVSGVAGTTTSIGGPPIALVYQHRPPAESRATLGVYFTLGALLSLAGLALGPGLALRDLHVAALMLPSMLVGFAASGVLRRRVPAGQVRVLMLTLCALSATILVVRSALG